MKLDTATIKSFLIEFEQASVSKDFDLVAQMIHPDSFFRFNDGDFYEAKFNSNHLIG